MQSLKKLLFFFIFLVSINAYAVLDLQLTQGVKGAIPIAIVPFAGQPADGQAPDNVSNVINTDLQNSGRFNLMNTSDMKQTPHSADQVDFSYWQQQKLNNVVVGSVDTVGGGQYKVQFQLLSAMAGKAGSGKNSSAPDWKNSVLLSQSFTVDGSQLRGLAHHISDLIYQNLTGDRGVFSTKIAYVIAQQGGNGSSYSLEVSDMDGYNPKPLLRSPQPIMSPSWSPDGKRLAYVSFEGDRPIIYVQDLNSGSRQLVSNFDGLNSAPAWSPDGSKLALVLTRTGYPKIFIMNLSNHQVTQLTQGDSIDTEPSWSADGRTVYFTSSRGGNPQVYQTSVNGDNVKRTTFEGNYNASPSIAADGKMLAVLNGGGNQFNIAALDLTSGRYSVLTQSNNAQAPSIAPNGKMIMYSTQAGGRGVLGVVSTDGRVKMILPAREGDAREPAWSPFLN